MNSFNNTEEVTNMYDKSKLLISKTEFYETKEAFNKKLPKWNYSRDYSYNKVLDVVFDLLETYHISDHVYKHLYPLDFNELGENEKNFSYWKSSKKKKLKKRFKKIFDECYTELVNFVCNSNANVLILKYKAEKFTGYLHKRKDPCNKKVYWYCVIVHKEPNHKLIIKSAYPCEAPA